MTVVWRRQLRVVSILPVLACSWIAVSNSEDTSAAMAGLVESRSRQSGKEVTCKTGEIKVETFTGTSSGSAS